MNSKRIHNVLNIIPLVMMFGFNLSAAETAAPRLVRNTGTKSIDTVVDETHGSLRWTHGAFLYSDYGASGVPSTLYTLDRQGHVISSTRPEIPGASWAQEKAFDRLPDGALVVAGESYDAGGKWAPFIAWISAQGKTLQLLNTAPYMASMLAIAPDGTVWTIGGEMINHDTSATGVNQNAPILRHFDSTGKLLGAAIPQARFTGNHEGFRLADGFLSVTADRIGWYSSHYRGGEYLEISLADLSLKVYPGLPQNATPKDGRVLSFSLTDSGIPALSFQDNHIHKRSAYLFERASSKWVPIDAPPLGGYSYFPNLLGNDGDQLVFQYASEAAFFKLIP